MVFPNYYAMETNARFAIEQRARELECARLYHEQRRLQGAERRSPFGMVLGVVHSAFARLVAPIRAPKQTTAVGAGQ